MANIIVQITRSEAFRENIKERLGQAVDTSEYEEQAEKLTKQIRNKTKTLKKKALTIDNFDWDVKNADSLYDSLNEDYMRLHEEVKALEESLEEVEGMIESIKNQQVTMDGLYKFILVFGKAYNNLTEMEKKELANKFINKIEIFPEEKEDGSVIKSITFRFPKCQILTSAEATYREVISQIWRKGGKSHVRKTTKAAEELSVFRSVEI